MKELLKFIKAFYQEFISFFITTKKPMLGFEVPASGYLPSQKSQTPVYKPKLTKEQEKKSKQKKQVITLADYKSLRKKTYRVDYDINYHKLDYTFYPTVLIPRRGTIIKPPQPGRNANIGASEAVFLSHVKNHFDKILHISNDMCLFTKGKSLPYEPDITMWNVIQGRLTCIDIEIDEPYAGATGEPTHCKGYDIERNKDFLNRGWTVIRFSEEQIVEYPQKCCKVIAEVISDLVDNYDPPKNLLKLKPLQKEEYWDEEKSKRLANQKTRERLLNRQNFGFAPEKPGDYLLEDAFLKHEVSVEDQYKEFDSLIKRKSFVETRSNGEPNRQYPLPNRSIPKPKLSEQHKKKEPTNSNGNNPVTPTPKSPINKTVEPLPQSVIIEVPKSRAEKISTKLGNLKTKESGIDRTGSVVPAAKPVKPTRHYGGKVDKRVFELMKPKHNPFSTALVQKINIEKDFDFLKCRTEQGKLICKGKVHPEFCAEYELKIEYEEGFAPHVFITKPEIRPESKIHMYPDGSLCLYYPNDFTWKDNMNIADYFIPWAIEWIYCYEYYLLTGEWSHEEAPGHEVIDYVSKRKMKAS